MQTEAAVHVRIENSTNQTLFLRLSRTHVALFQNIEKALCNAGLLVRPKVFIPDTFSKQDRFV